MTPTGAEERIEGSPYKEYRYDQYCPIRASAQSSVYLPTTLPVLSEPEEPLEPTKSVNAKKDGATQNYIRFDIDMEEGGSRIFQYVAAAAANLAIVTCGAILTWSSPVLPMLKKTPVDPDNPLGRAITDDEASWIGSLVALGALCGGLVAGYLGEKFGRKRSLLGSAVPFLVGWILIATAKDIEQIYAARFLFGLSLAIPFTIVPMYCGEIAETAIRGALGSFLQLFITIGLLYSYVIGPYVSYMVLWICCGCLPIVFFLCFMFMPESPYFLLSKGDKIQATEALVKLRGRPAADVQKEIDDIQVSIDEAAKSQATMADLFKVKTNFKALLYTCAMVSFQQLTGINVVLFYTESIFLSTGTTLDTALCTIIVGVIQTAASMVTPLVVDRLGRRILCIVSGTGTTVTLAALGIFFYLKNVTKQDVTDISWLPVVSLVIFISVYSIGWGPLPWTVMGEMFAPDVKAKASGITVGVCWGLAFIITKFFTNIEAVFGTHTAFWIFGVFCIISVLFTVFILPETKGKSLQQIQDELSGVKSINLENDGENSSKL